MRNFAYGLVCALSVAISAQSCKTIQYVPVKGDTQVEYRDSIITKLDTITVTRTETQKVRDYTGLLNVLEMETKYARATAWVDTTSGVGILKGTLEDKDVPLEVVVPSKEEYHQKDSIKVEQVPYKVEVVKEKKVYPKWLVVLSILGTAALVILAVQIFLKLKKKLPI